MRVPQPKDYQDCEEKKRKKKKVEIRQPPEATLSQKLSFPKGD